jgi:uncharacterized lipoprotein YddW (UPF0748 family)
MRIRDFVTMTVLLLCAASGARAQNADGLQPVSRRGIWVSVFSDRKVLYSKDAVKDLVGFCRKTGISEIYLQVFQSGRAYYDSKLAGRAAYEKMLQGAGADPVDLLIEEAHAAELRVYAWMNMLSVGGNTKAPVVSLLGESALTRDQHARLPMGNGDNDLDAYYMRENQVFLDPGDYRVREYLMGIVAELAERYPELDGIHLDYARYPYGLPFVPGSRFNKYGLTYGYSEKNIAAFTKATGLDPVHLHSDHEYLEWDSWKRQRVTLLVENLRTLLKQKRPLWKLSAAVLPVWDRAYNSAFQDWPAWLDDGIVDYVVLMNYTLDERQFEYCCRSGVALKSRGKVYAGIGAFLMDEVPAQIRRQDALARQAGCDGVVFFSYNGLTPAMEGAIADEVPAL